MSKVTIHSDGTADGTVVLDSEGNKLEGVKSISFYVSAETGTSEVSLELLGLSSILQGKVADVNWTCPGCGQVQEHSCSHALGDAACGDTLKFQDPYCVEACTKQNGHDGPHSWARAT